MHFIKRYSSVELSLISMLYFFNALKSGGGKKIDVLYSVTARPKAKETYAKNT